MKNYTKNLVAIMVILIVIITAVNCTKNNQVLDTSSSSAASTILTAVKGTATLQPQGVHHPAIAANAAEWANAPKLTVLATVPSGNGIFPGFTGNSDSVTVQAMYDGTNIYFLYQFLADFPNCASSPWYYNPTTHVWGQEASTPTLVPGTTTFRPPFIQDEFVMMFDINNSTRNFNTLSCYVACHFYSGYGVDTPVGGAMWTNGPTEFLDCWRARTLQVLNENQASDCYIWNGGGMLNKHSVPADTSLPSRSNKQSLTITGKTTKMNVPIYVYPATSQYGIYPGGTYAPGAILSSDTGSLAVRVVAVDSFGVLTLVGGGTIDPRPAANGYQQLSTGGDGQYCIPGSIIFPYIGSQADVTANFYWTGTGWQLLLSRKLNTGDAVHDADFSSLSDQPFGFGIMYNGADNQHAIVTGLTLHFKK